MTQRVLIVSHADADGHIIAEQTRRNLEVVPTFDVTILVDPKRTSGHKMWMHLNELHEIDSSDIVVFVDLMFAPSSFAAEADALVAFVNARPTKHFFLFDHHPLPERRLRQADNLRAVYKPDVLDCTVGKASWMMVVAALLEKQPTRAGEIKSPIHDELATGVRRAAALGGPLPGEKLLALMRCDRWADLVELGREDAAKHRLARGRRPSGGRSSSALTKLDKLATELLQLKSGPQTSAQRPSNHQPARRTMSYDFEIAADRLPLKVDVPEPRPRDLETIVTLLELAAIMLTKGPESTFSADELISEARRLGGDGIGVEETDVRIVLGKAGFLKKVGGRLRLK